MISDSGRTAVMEALIDAVMGALSKSGPSAHSPCYTRKFIQERLDRMFPAFETPDHPPYSLMIQQAIAKLDEEGGSREDSISKWIASEYDSLPWAHASFLSHHLRKLRYGGDIVCVNGCYMLPVADGMGSVLPVPSKEFERAHEKGRAQNKKLKREAPLGTRDIDSELEIKQRRTHVEAAFGGDKSHQMEMRINLQGLELATEEINPVKENEQDPQCQWSREANPAAEKIDDEPVVEPVQGSDEQHTTTQRIPMQQEPRVARDNSDEQQMQLHTVISSSQDQVEAHPVGVEGTEQIHTNSESRSRAAEEPPRQIQADDFSMRFYCTENQNKAIDGQGEESLSSEQIVQQILMVQEKMGDLVERLKQSKEAPGNCILLREKLAEVLRWNRRIGLDFQELHKASLESLSSVINETLRDSQVNIPSQDLCTTDDGAAGVRFSFRQLQKKQSNFGTAERHSLFLKPCPRRQRGILLKNSGEKRSDNFYHYVVALPVQGCSEKIQKKQQQREGTELCAVQGAVLELQGGTNEALPSVSVGERAFPAESVFHTDRCLELELVSDHGRDSFLKNEIKEQNDVCLCVEQIKECAVISNELGDLNDVQSLDEPPMKMSELPINKALSRMESPQTSTKSITETRDADLFPAEQACPGQTIPEQPPLDELARDNTIAYVTNYGSPDLSTSSNPLIPKKKRYKRRDKSSTNWVYREKL